jgi:hypothetical protein
VSFRVTGGTITFTPAVMNLTGGANQSTKTGTITVHNSATGANAGPVTMTAAPTIAPIPGPTGGTFSITGGTCTATTVLNPGGTCTIIVQYLPQGAAAEYFATVTVTDTGAATATQTYTLGAN